MPYALGAMIHDQHQRGAPLDVTLMCGVFFVGAFACLFLSAMFHTMYECCSEAGSLWSKLDYVGITLLILASNYPTVHLMFYCKPLLVWLYLGIVRERYLLFDHSLCGAASLT